MKRWIGRWLMVVGALHVPFSLVFHRAVWLDIANAGFFGTVAGQVLRGHAAWFLLFGPVLVLVGAALDALEKARLRPPLLLGVGMLLLTAFALVLMPRSGFWLILPPTFALLAGAAKT